MTIVQKIINSIKAAVGDYVTETVGGVETQVWTPDPVYYHDEATLNLFTSQMDFPCAVFQLLTSGSAVMEGGQMKETVSAAVFFVEPSQFDFDAVDNEVIIDRCRERAFQWLASLSMSSLVTLRNTVRTSRVYDRYDDILTGFGVFVDLVENNGYCL